MTRVLTPFSIIRQHCRRWVDSKSSRHTRHTTYASWAARPERENRHHDKLPAVKGIDRGQFRKQLSHVLRSEPFPDFAALSAVVLPYSHNAQSSTSKDDRSLRSLRSGKGSEEKLSHPEDRVGLGARDVKYVDKVTSYTGHSLSVARLRLPVSALPEIDRGLLLRQMFLDVKDNTERYEQGTLLPFSRPEYAYAAYDALLDRLDASLWAYRRTTTETVSAFRDGYHELRGIMGRRRNVDRHALKNRVLRAYRKMRQERLKIASLTRDVKDFIKVTHAGISRDNLFTEHVTRLAAFKTSFHRVMTGWLDVRRIMYEGNAIFPRRYTALLPYLKINEYRSEIGRAKYIVKVILDARLRHNNLPLFHLKKAVDFYHEMLRATSPVVHIIEELRELYHTQILRGNLEYRLKWCCINAWSKYIDIESLEISAIYRALAFYASAHVRAKYDYQPTRAEGHQAASSELPNYVRYGLALQQHHDSLGPLPLPCIRPNSSGEFSKLHFEGTEYVEFLEHSQVEVSESVPVSHLDKTEPYESHPSSGDQLGNAVDELDEIDALPHEVMDTSSTWDDSDFPRVEDISFPSTHGRLSKLRYGSLLGRRKELYDTAQAHPVDDEILESTGSSIAAYAALYRGQGDYVGGQSLRSPYPVVTERRLLSPELVKPWQSSFQQRSRSRPTNYGALLHRFQGITNEGKLPTIDIMRAPQPSSRASNVSKPVTQPHDQSRGARNEVLANEDTALDVFTASLNTQQDSGASGDSYLDMMVDTVLQKEARDLDAGKLPRLVRSTLSTSTATPLSVQVPQAPYDDKKTRRSFPEVDFKKGSRRPGNFAEQARVSKAWLAKASRGAFREEGSIPEQITETIQHNVNFWQRKLFSGRLRTDHSSKNDENVDMVERTARYWQAKLDKLTPISVRDNDSNSTHEHTSVRDDNVDRVESASSIDNSNLKVSSLHEYGDDVPDPFHHPLQSSRTLFALDGGIAEEDIQEVSEQPSSRDGPAASISEPASSGVHEFDKEDRQVLRQLSREARMSRLVFKRTVWRAPRDRVLQQIQSNVDYWQARLDQKHATGRYHKPLHLTKIQDILRLWHQKYKEYSQMPGPPVSGQAPGTKQQFEPKSASPARDVIVEAKVDSPSQLRIQIDNLREQIDGLQRIKVELERLHELDSSQCRHVDGAERFVDVKALDTTRSLVDTLPAAVPNALSQIDVTYDSACRACGTVNSPDESTCFVCKAYVGGYRRLQLDVGIEQSTLSTDAASSSLRSTEPLSPGRTDGTSTLPMSCPRCYFDNQPTRSMCDQCGQPLKVSRTQRVLLEQDRRQQITQDIAVDALAKEVGPNLMAEFEQEIAQRNQDLKILEGEDEGDANPV
jgi:hypothetical protein